MSILDIYRQVMLAGVIQPLQANLNFASGFTIVANPTLNSLDVSVTGGGGGISALTGDVTASGSGSVVATVAKVNGATVPAAGALTTGNAAYVSGVSALTYSALNLAGGAGWVTGVLPVGNQAAQTMGGDVSGTTATATVTQAQGGIIAFAGTTTPSITSGGSATQLTIGTTKSAASILFNTSAGSLTAQLGISTYPTLWIGSAATTSGNYSMQSDGTSFLGLNAPANAGSINFYCGASIYAAISNSYFTFGNALVGLAAPLVISFVTAAAPTVQAGTSATSLSVGTNNSGATLSLKYGAAVTGLTLGGNGIAPGVGTQSLTAGGSITPSAAVLANPYITLTGTLGSATTVVLPNAVGMWWFDISVLNFGGTTLKFNSGSANTSTLSSLVTTTEIVQVFCGGGNTISINV